MKFDFYARYFKVFLLWLFNFPFLRTLFDAASKSSAIFGINRLSNLILHNCSDNHFCLLICISLLVWVESCLHAKNFLHDFPASMSSLLHWFILDSAFSEVRHQNLQGLWRQSCFQVLLLILATSSSSSILAMSSLETMASAVRWRPGSGRQGLDWLPPETHGLPASSSGYLLLCCDWLRSFWQPCCHEPHV